MALLVCWWSTMLLLLTLIALTTKALMTALTAMPAGRAPPAGGPGVHCRRWPVNHTLHTQHKEGHS